MIDQITKKKYQQTKARAKLRGLDFSLSIVEYSNLLEDAGITAENIGQGKHDYCLGRYGDEGGYIVGNCRFITVDENNKEGMITKVKHGHNLGGGSRESLKGNKHHSNRGYIITPWGKFETLTQAANHPLANCNRQTVCKRINRGEPGYRYE